MKFVRLAIIGTGLATGAIFGLLIGLLLKSLSYGLLAFAITAFLAIWLLCANYCR